MTADIIRHISVSHPGIPIKVPAVQGDTGRRILFTVTDMDIPSGSSATIYAKKPSGAEIYNSCAVSQSSSGASVITVDLTSATLEETGEIPAQIQVVNGEDIVTTFLFLLCVQKNIITDSAIEGTNEFTSLQKATAAANQAASAANQAKQDADEATEAANRAANAAVTAAGTANSAASAANQAKQDADEATEAANSAANAATTAAGTANSAASDATSAAEAANEAAEAANNAAAGDVSNKTVTFQEAAERANIESGDSLAVSFGKLAKFCADFGDAAFAGIANNLTTNTPGSVLDAQQGKVLGDEINELNTKINLINVESIERQGNANSMVSQSNSTAFYKITASSGTTANNFPVNSAGCLMVMNLYEVHVIQVFFPLGNRLFIRHIVSAPEAGSSWTAWKEIN